MIDRGRGPAPGGWKGVVQMKQVKMTVINKKEEIEEALTKCGIPLNVRGEALSLEQFAEISNIFSDR